MFDIQIIKKPIARAVVRDMAPIQHGEMVKAVVDVQQSIMALGGELHADAEWTLLEAGSKQEDLWGINLFPATQGEDWLVFDSMINIRPRQNNRSRSVEDPGRRERIRSVVDSLIA